MEEEEEEKRLARKEGGAQVEDLDGLCVCILYVGAKGGEAKTRRREGRRKRY